MALSSRRIDAAEDPRGLVRPAENILAIAVSLTAAGFHISPWHVFENGDKEPAIDPSTGRAFAWGEGSTTDHETAVEWWMGEYANCFPGINVGKSGLLVIDLDQHDEKDGERSLKEAGLVLPPTTKFHSRRDGWHHYYRAPLGRNLKSSISDLEYHGTRLTGVDVKAGNGLVIYYNGLLTADRIASLTFAPAPEWACQEVGTSYGRTGDVEYSDWVAACRPGTPEDSDRQYTIDHFKVTGVGHDAARDAIWHLVSRASDGQPGIPALLDMARTVWLAPPWQEFAKDWRSMVQGAVNEFGLPSPLATGVRGEQHSARSQWEASVAAAGGVIEDDEPVFPPDAAPEVVEAVLAAEPSVPPVAHTVDQEREHRIHVEALKIIERREALRLADVLEAPADVSLANFADWMVGVEPKQPIVDGIIYRDSLTLWAATGGSGKTAALCGVVMAMGNDFEFLGRTVQQGRVLLCEGEGLQDLPKRMFAWANHKRLVNPRFDHITMGPSDGLNVASLKALRERHREAKWDLIVLDTFSALFSVESENDNAEVAAILRELRGFITDVPGTAVVLLHHTTNTGEPGKKSYKARGASAFRDNADTVVVMFGDRNDVTISTDPEHNGKQRDAQPDTLTGLAIGVIDVPQVGFGHTGPVIETQTPRHASAARERLHEVVTCFSRLQPVLRSSEWQDIYSGRTGMSDFTFKTYAGRALQAGLVEREDTKRTAPYRPTERGWDFIADITTVEYKTHDGQD